MRRVLMVVTLASIASVFSPELPAQTSGDMEQYRRQCNAGRLEDCNALGVLYDRADIPGVASRLFARACDGGVQVACSNLAELYFDGRGVQQDLSRASQLFKGACEAEVLSGCAGVCLIMRQRQDSTPQARSLCRQILEKACAQEGNPRMCDQRSAAASSRAPACRTGAIALVDAYLRANAIYALVLGDLQSYVANNREHFTADGDAIGCARVLSQALMNGALVLHDPEWQPRHDALRAQLGAMGISAGPARASPTAQLYAMGQQLSWLADVLPAAAMGDFRPLRTPQTEEQRWGLFVAEMLRELLQDPWMREAFREVEPLVREAAESDRQMLLGMARELAR